MPSGEDWAHVTVWAGHDRGGLSRGRITDVDVAFRFVGDQSCPPDPKAAEDSPAVAQAHRCAHPRLVAEERGDGNGSGSDGNA